MKDASDVFAHFKVENLFLKIKFSKAIVVPKLESGSTPLKTELQ